jgi:uncharacterized membrane protein YcaP (DUF421 family)
MEDVQFWWDSWEPMVRILLVTSLGYLTLIALLRISGPRTLSKMTPFDFIIAVTIGSGFGRVVTAVEVSVAEMALAFFTLVALQWIVAFLRERSSVVNQLVDVRPTLLYHRGEVQHRALRTHRLRERDLLAAVRQNGMGSLAQAEAIVLESDGGFSILSSAQMGDAAAMEPVQSR